jgi:hypothetical protein
MFLWFSCSCGTGIPYEERADDPELFSKRNEVFDGGFTRGAPKTVPHRCFLMSDRALQIIVAAAKKLDECQMIRFEETSGAFGVTDLGRVASHFYIQVREAFRLRYVFSLLVLSSQPDVFIAPLPSLRLVQNESIFMFNREMTQSMSDPAILRLICLAREFDNIRVRDEELPELDVLKQRCHMEVLAFFSRLDSLDGCHLLHSCLLISCMLCRH